MANSLSGRGIVRVAVLCLGMLGMGAACGCRSFAYRREPLSTASIIEMSREKVPPDEIIQKIRDSRTVYVLHARDVKELLDKGVDERVIDEMLQTPIREARYNSYYCSPYYPYPYYYGPYFGIGYGVTVAP